MISAYLQKHTFVFYSLIAVIISLSYSFFSTENYPLLNSDDGLGVLMAHYYDLPHDIYCWGQDRGGTLIQFVSQLWIWMGVSSIRAVSVTQFLFLIIGYAGFSSLLKNRTGKLLFALIWFLPYHQFIDLTRYPIGTGYSIIGGSLLFIRLLQFEGKSYFNWKNHLILMSLTIWLGAGIWLSDLVAINLFCLLVAYYFYQIRTSRKWTIRPEVLVWFIVGAVIWGQFIYSSKVNSPAKTEGFQTINSMAEIGQCFETCGAALRDVFTGAGYTIFTQLFAWLFTLLAITLILLRLRGSIRFSSEQKKWLSFLWMDTLAVSAVFFTLHWVLVNQMASRYFVSSYITFSLIVLISHESIAVSKKSKQLISGVLMATILTGSASHFFFLWTKNPGKWRSSASYSREFEKMGNCGVIADYWYAYRHSCVNPELIHATPHDMSDVKNRALVPEVFAQPRLFIIGDGWLQTFPDTLVQFKIPLKKKGKPFRLAGNSVCEYRRLPLNHVYTADELGLSDPKRKIVENGKSIIRIEYDPVIMDQIVQSGPMNTLVPGKYSLTYYMRADSLPETDTIIGEILISAEYGAIPIKQIPVESALFRDGKEHAVIIPFSLKEFTFNVEYLLRTKGNAEITILEIRQEEK